MLLAHHRFVFSVSGAAVIDIPRLGRIRIFVDVQGMLVFL